ncbi:Positive regulator of CheA protein activity (CheW) [Candidatus Syntrophocurvum alkaliphilum]|uniref:Positive regulator of CheA protein activity (CheW) n=1 Tax=Candidatus Syntrophocurvum alkaliphilum TaxID=2293317 RepID=A0A6I6D7Z9_9FIRM|nr:chemotaxis protein CheW [Candidatus Syntrophocurvum alkaliphilum]QGT98737.1 Positive regulator of CheA protein activity (CheW) [Candidatus Syntrophocurvum alkaliphilum]
MAEEIQLVVFTLKTDDMVCEYGVPITKVQEIIPMMTPTRLPQVPDFVEGVVNLRGKIVPIIDLKKRFNIGATEITNDTRSVVVEVDGQTVGIIVDEVSEVLLLSDENIEPPPAVVGGITAEYLTGVGKLQQRLLILLDMDKILSDTEKANLATVSELEN